MILMEENVKFNKEVYEKIKKKLVNDGLRGKNKSFIEKCLIRPN